MAHEDLVSLSIGLDTVLKENTQLVELLNRTQFEGVTGLIRAAPSVFAAGAGRSGLVLKMTAMRLMHLGMAAHVVGETTTPAIGAGDLLIAASGSGTTPSVVRSAAKSREVGANVLAFTTAADSALAELATRVVVLPAAQKQDHGTTVSHQYSGSLFEQGLLLVTDALFHALWQIDGSPAEELWPRHANLE